MWWKWNEPPFPLLSKNLSHVSYPRPYSHLTIWPFISLTMMKKESISCTNLFLNDFSCLCQIKYPCEARAKKKIVKRKIIAHFRWICQLTTVLYIEVEKINFLKNWNSDFIISGKINACTQSTLTWAMTNKYHSVGPITYEKLSHWLWATRSDNFIGTLDWIPLYSFFIFFYKHIQIILLLNGRGTP